MHVLIATDGSRLSLGAATYLRSTVAADVVTKVSVVAVVSPLVAVPFATDDDDHEPIDQQSFRRSAERATEEIAAVLDGWGPPVTTHVYSGQPAAVIVKAAERFGSGLIVIASQSSRAKSVLMGSVAHRVVNQATCPVLVHRPGPKRPRTSRRAKRVTP